MTNNNERGQTLILMLIVTVISLTIGVAISSRAVSTLKQTSYTAQAGKAQKFADAGVEHALPDPASELGCTAASPCGLDVDGDLDDSEVSYYVEQSGGGSDPITFQLGKDETQQLNLTNTSLGKARISWNGDAAIVYSIIHKDSGGSVTIQQKGASDPNESDACSLPAGSSDPSVSSPGVGSGSYAHSIDAAGLSVGVGEDLYLRIRPLCEDNVDMQIEGLTAAGGAVSLPNQGYIIVSTGAYGETEWTTEVTKMNPALSSIFDYAIFSDSSLTK